MECKCHLMDLKMLKIKVGNDIYNHYEYSSEDDFERRIVKESKNIFGNSSIYLDIKKNTMYRFDPSFQRLFLPIHTT